MHFFSFLLLLHIFIALPTSNVCCVVQKVPRQQQQLLPFLPLPLPLLLLQLQQNFSELAPTFSANRRIQSPSPTSKSFSFPFRSFFLSLSFLLCRSDIRTDICKWVFLLISNFFSFFLFSFSLASTGAVIYCSATGRPVPKVTWETANGQTISELTGKRERYTLFSVFEALFLYQ